MKKLIIIMIFSLLCITNCLSNPISTLQQSEENILPEYVFQNSIPVEILPPDYIYSYGTTIKLPEFIYVASSHHENGIFSPCYWQGTNNITVLPIPAGVRFFSVSAITKGNGIIYAAGGYESNNGWRPCYWKNTERIDLPINEGANGVVNAILVDDGVVYTLGTLWYGMRGRVEQDCYWQETTKIDLPDTVRVRSFTIKNEVIFTAGSYKDENNMWKPCYLQGTNIIDLSIPNGASGSVSSITIANETVYTVGSYNESGISKPCYWQGMDRFALSFPEGSICYMNSIIVNNGIVFIAGSYISDRVWRGIETNTNNHFGNNNYYISSNYLNNEFVYPVFSPVPSRWMACYWQDEKRIDLDYFVGISSPLCSIVVSNGTVYNTAFIGSGNAKGIYWENNIQYNLDIYGYGIQISAVFIDK